MLIFDDGQSMANITSKIGPIYWAQNQEASQFGYGRCAYLFKPVKCSPFMDVGCGMTVRGLGRSPDKVGISGAVQSLATRTKGLALNLFWRGMENFKVIQTTDPQFGPEVADFKTTTWAVSQATSLRRLHVNGQLFVRDNPFQEGNFASGGFMADCKVEHITLSGSQQQFLMRNCSFDGWDGGVWNKAFVGDDQPPSVPWHDKPFTVVQKTPAIREKPYLIFEDDTFKVVVPGFGNEVQSTSQATDPRITIDFTLFHIAKPATDIARAHRKWEYVIAYGLFVEHFQGFQTEWNGERGQLYFYQSELPYDVPDQLSWRRPGGENGSPSYKVSDQVMTHTARGLGIYSNFNNNVELKNAISTPRGSGIQMKLLVTVWLDGAPGNSIKHIINGDGDTVPKLLATM